MFGAMAIEGWVTEHLVARGLYRDRMACRARWGDAAPSRPSSSLPGISDLSEPVPSPREAGGGFRPEAELRRHALDLARLGPQPKFSLVKFLKDLGQL